MSQTKIYAGIVKNPGEFAVYQMLVRYGTAEKPTALIEDHLNSFADQFYDIPELALPSPGTYSHPSFMPLSGVKMHFRTNPDSPDAMIARTSYVEDYQKVLSRLEKVVSYFKLDLVKDEHAVPHLSALIEQLRSVGKWNDEEFVDSLRYPSPSQKYKPRMVQGEK